MGADLRGRRLLLAEAIERLYDQEHHECDDQERDKRVNEVTDGEGYRTCLDDPIFEIHIGKEDVEKRCDEIGDERVDDRLECSTDDNANGHLKDISACDEILKFLNHNFSLQP